MHPLLQRLARLFTPSSAPLPAATPVTVARSARHQGHHPVFDRFQGFRGASEEGFSYGFLGDRFRAEFGGWARPPAADLALGPPPFDEDYLEWLDILEAALEAKETFVFLELGAGFGRWSVRAAKATHQLGKRIRLTMAEADPRHVDFIHANMADNGIAPGEYQVHEAAVSGSAGEVAFCVGAPGHDGSWYGQSIVGPDVGDSPRMGDYCGRPLYSYQGGWAHVIRLRQMTLSEILDGHKRVDLADLDLQGCEADAVAEAIGLLNLKVRRLHIGTHGAEIEVRLRDILGNAGWICLRDYSLNQANATPFGTFEFNDGLQTWLNPRLA